MISDVGSYRELCDNQCDNSSDSNDQRQLMLHIRLWLFLITEKNLTGNRRNEKS
jgi:hypothetical protein